MVRLLGSMVVAIIIIVFGYDAYLQPRPEQLACDRAIQASADFGPSFVARSHTSTATADGVSVNVMFTTTNAKGEALGNFYSCDLAKQPDGSLKVSKVYLTPNGKN